MNTYYLGAVASPNYCRRTAQIQNSSQIERRGRSNRLLGWGVSYSDPLSRGRVRLLVGTVTQNGTASNATATSGQTRCTVHQNADKGQASGGDTAYAGRWSSHPSYPPGEPGSGGISTLHCSEASEEKCIRNYKLPVPQLAHEGSWAVPPPNLQWDRPTCVSSPLFLETVGVPSH